MAFLKAFGRWLWRAWPAGAFMLGFVVAAAPVWWCWPQEIGFRYGGLLLELSGIVTVWWGIQQTRKLFEHPSFFAETIQWISEIPLRSLWRRDTMVALGSGTISIRGSGAAVGHAGLPPNATIDERVQRLEKELSTLREDLRAEKKEVAEKLTGLSREKQMTKHYERL